MSRAPYARPVLAGLTALTLAAPGAAAAQWSAQSEDRSWGLDVSLILEGIYYNEMTRGNQDPAGFDDGHDHGHSHGHDHGHDHGFDDGFNLGHSELVFEANLGDLFDGVLMVGFDEDHVEVEEAFLTTRALPGGFQIKAGKFLSDIGYINSRHGHDWDFVDRPLVNEYLFGDHGLQDTGVQATWVAPTEMYTQLGVELLQGDQDEGIAAFDSDLPVSEKSGPRVTTAFAKFGPNLGADHAVQFGVSGGYVAQTGIAEDHGNHAHGLEGDAWFGGLDAVYKYSSGRAYGHGDWTLQGEYFYMRQSLDQYDGHEHGHGHHSHMHWERTSSLTTKQDGLYLQAVYGFAPRWEAGLRTEALGLTNDAVEGSHHHGHDYFEVESFGTSYRHSAQVTFRPVEPVFLRAQLSQNDFIDDHDRRDRGLEFMLQLNVALGAHGAHRF
ncbi:hypothetical protein [Thioalkalivibrio sp. ALE9]|uniref:hypothetical protein n=1 Tax=Thioalkalivibrio sp. ALE9 TaxID=1158169 RepID=UPI000360791A|nr:hypothetical protein [Thioalkalivibrio sp. ALE9]